MRNTPKMGTSFNPMDENINNLRPSIPAFSRLGFFQKATTKVSSDGMRVKPSLGGKTDAFRHARIVSDGSFPLSEVAPCLILVCFQPLGAGFPQLFRLHLHCSAARCLHKQLRLQKHRLMEETEPRLHLRNRADRPRVALLLLCSTPKSVPSQPAVLSKPAPSYFRTFQRKPA